jgi:16S rRNA (uracil1498-N3)-methyltransferase
MPAERYFLEKDLSLEGIETLEGQEFHHLYHVMRAKQGDTLEIFNGKGALAQAEIEQISKRHASVKITSIEVVNPPEIQIIIAQAIPRINRLDFIVEKCTELGMYELWLFPGQNSERKDLTDHQLERLKNLTVAASKQSGRLWLPKICVKPALIQWKQVEHKAFFGDVSPSAQYLSKILVNNPPENRCMFITGPESGFSILEEQHLRNIEAQGVKLLDAILRTDTASIMALSTLIACSQIHFTNNYEKI